MKKYALLGLILTTCVQVNAQQLITETSNVNEWLKPNNQVVGKFGMHPQAPTLRDGMQEWANRFGLQLAWQVPQNASGHDLRHALRAARLDRAETPEEAIERINIAFAKLSEFEYVTACVIPEQKVLVVIEDGNVPQGCKSR